MAKSVVHLGFAEDVVDRRRLESRFFPLGKVGGRPSWLALDPLPPAEQLLCQVCQTPMVFLLQIYAPIEDTDKIDDQCFHRTIFIFMCRDPKCSVPNKSGNMGIFRCQLGRQNDFYPYDPVNPDDEQQDDSAVVQALDLPHACPTCGCEAGKKCAKCELVWYCSREHQAIHWRASHKANCGQEGDGLGGIKPFENAFLFPEFEIVMETEENVDHKDDDEEEEEDDDDEEERDEAARMKDYRQFLAERLNERDGVAIAADELDEFETAQTADRNFQLFKRRIALNPDQILRYDRGSLPLWATDKNTPAEHQVPACPLCGRERTFEFQLTPTLLTLLGQEEHLTGPSIDWATVAVYTCTCPIPDKGYAAEFAYKQDF